ncbi:hypothetical protein FRC03_001436 [Tulasnella sp. 419]|nr:hypothetical protein FRC03_001436 [Tulasnella sp. 419]
MVRKTEYLLGKNKVDDVSRSYAMSYNNTSSHRRQAWQAVNVMGLVDRHHSSRRSVLSHTSSFSSTYQVITNGATSRYSSASTSPSRSVPQAISIDNPPTHNNFEHSQPTSLSTCFVTDVCRV